MVSFSLSCCSVIVPVNSNNGKYTNNCSKKKKNDKQKIVPETDTINQSQNRVYITFKNGKFPSLCMSRYLSPWNTY